MHALWVQRLRAARLSVLLRLGFAAAELLVQVLVPVLPKQTWPLCLTKAEKTAYEGFHCVGRPSACCCLTGGPDLAAAIPWAEHCHLYEQPLQVPPLPFAARLAALSF